MTEVGIRYFGIKIITTDQKLIDLIIDEINSVHAIFVKQKEFDSNVKNIIKAGIMDNDSGTLIVADVYFDGTGLIKIL